MRTLSPSLVCLTTTVSFILQTTVHAINDFRVGIQLCDGNAGANIGAVQYTPFLYDGNGWSLWAGDSNYYDPDGIRIGLFGRNNNALPPQFRLENIDIRLCVQVTDHASNTAGNAAEQGSMQCTPWAGDGAGWSAWAGDSNWYDFDAVRVKLETRENAGLVIADIKVGVQLTDSKTSTSKMGVPQESSWLIGNQVQTSTWSEWAGDSNWYDPDSVRVYLAVEKAFL
eukprot:CAMPEP_0197032728 /NCGR_PEP_ID=MMETSP1384-20130603/11330_1 /TAXON_ID=29189 /ORGANISM="Ammonia sp." /LENGTH=225 /DNA_ID=CAMNT_0042462427 /DNA_START=40 /DNA_END=717 /DNA_ORIENTATION=-